MRCEGTTQLQRRGEARNPPSPPLSFVLSTFLLLLTVAPPSARLTILSSVGVEAATPSKTLSHSAASHSTSTSYALTYTPHSLSATISAGPPSATASTTCSKASDTRSASVAISVSAATTSQSPDAPTASPSKGTRTWYHLHSLSRSINTPSSSTSNDDMSLSPTVSAGSPSSDRASGSETLSPQVRSCTWTTSTSFTPSRKTATDGERSTSSTRSGTQQQRTVTTSISLAASTTSTGSATSSTTRSPALSSSESPTRTIETKSFTDERASGSFATIAASWSNNVPSHSAPSMSVTVSSTVPNTNTRSTSGASTTASGSTEMTRSVHSASPTDTKLSLSGDASLSSSLPKASSTSTQTFPGNNGGGGGLSHTVTMHHTTTLTPTNVDDTATHTPRPSSSRSVVGTVSRRPPTKSISSLNDSETATADNTPTRSLTEKRFSVSPTLSEGGSLSDTPTQGDSFSISRSGDVPSRSFSDTPSSTRLRASQTARISGSPPRSVSKASVSVSQQWSTSTTVGTASSWTTHSTTMLWSVVHPIGTVSITRPTDAASSSTTISTSVSLRTSNTPGEVSTVSTSECASLSLTSTASETMADASTTLLLTVTAHSPSPTSTVSRTQSMSEPRSVTISTQVTGPSTSKSPEMSSTRRGRTTTRNRGAHRQHDGRWWSRSATSTSAWTATTTIPATNTVELSKTKRSVSATFTNGAAALAGLTLSVTMVTDQKSATESRDGLSLSETRPVSSPTGGLQRMSATSTHSFFYASETPSASRSAVLRGGGGYSPRIKVSLVLEGAQWATVVDGFHDAIVSGLLEILSRSFGIPPSDVTVESITVGSLRLVFFVQRRTPTIMALSDDDLAALLRRSDVIAPLLQLYSTTTGAVSGGVVDVDVSSPSVDGVSSASCGSSCAGLAVGCVLGSLLCAVAVVLYARDRRWRRQRDIRSREPPTGAWYLEHGGGDGDGEDGQQHQFHEPALFLSPVVAEEAGYDLTTEGDCEPFASNVLPPPWHREIPPAEDVELVDDADGFEEYASSCSAFIEEERDGSSRDDDLIDRAEKEANAQQSLEEEAQENTADMTRHVTLVSPISDDAQEGGLHLHTHGSLGFGKSGGDSSMEERPDPQWSDRALLFAAQPLPAAVSSFGVVSLPESSAREVVHAHIFGRPHGDQRTSTDTLDPDIQRPRSHLHLGSHIAPPTQHPQPLTTVVRPPSDAMGALQPTQPTTTAVEAFMLRRGGGGR